MGLSAVSDLIRRCSASANLDATPYALGVMHSLVQHDESHGPCRQQTNAHCQNICPQHGRQGQESKQQLWEQQRCNTSTLQQPSDHNLLLMDTSLPLFAPAQKVHFFPLLDLNQQQPQQQQKQSPDSSQESAWATFRQEPRSAPTQSSRRLSASAPARSAHAFQTDVMYLPVSKVVRGEGRRSLPSSGAEQQQQQPQQKSKLDYQQHLEHQPRQEQQPRHISHLSEDMSWDHPTLPRVPTRIRHWATRRAADVVECDRTPDREDVIRAIKAAAAEAPQWRARFAAASFNSDCACEEPVSSTRKMQQPALAAAQLPEISFWPVQYSNNDLQAALATVVPCVSSSTAAASAISSCMSQPSHPSCSLPSSNVFGAQHAYAFSLQQPARGSCIPHSEVVIAAPLCTNASTSQVGARADRTLCVIDMNSRSFSDALPSMIPACEHLVRAQKPLPTGKDVPVLSSPEQQALSLAAHPDCMQDNTNPGMNSPRQEDAPSCVQDRLMQPHACIHSAAKPLAPAKPSAKGSLRHATPPDAARIDQPFPAKDAAPTQRRRRDVRAEEDEDYEAPAQRSSSCVSSRPRVRGPVASRVKALGASSCNTTCIGPAGVSPCVRRALDAPVADVGPTMQQGEQDTDIGPGEYAAPSGPGVAMIFSADDECMDAAMGAAQGLHKASHSSRREGKRLKLTVAFKEDEAGNSSDSDSDKQAPAKVRKTAGQKKQRDFGEEEQPKANKSMRSKE